MSIRRLALVMAALMACVGAWLLVPDLLKYSRLHARLGPLQIDQRKLLELAATIGLVRGDLWGAYAETFAAPEALAGSCDAGTREAANGATKALLRSPHDARIWLILAAAEQRCQPNSVKAAGAMRMSFYTGAYETGLIRDRLPLALDNLEIKDPEFRRLVLHDVQTAIVSRPELAPAVIEIYKKASPAGRKLLREAAGEFALRFDFHE